MSNGIEMLSYPDITQASGVETGWFGTGPNDLNLLPFVLVLAFLFVLYGGIKQYLKRI
ncbi:hypothetical protein [Rudanella paleaurantiibacter]|uniref:hypothetical protein n=1 Tax=Rudanella paleaurantiibacter TaxID=2614655 RepID=UPI000365091F|nr:hypothetical protein [Rudanella paleaurantiibacter]